MGQEKKVEGRRSLRFSPDIGAHAEIGGMNAKGDFTVEKAALIADESYSGVGLIIIDDEKYIPGVECHIKIGNIGPIKGRVIWKRVLEDKAAHIGINFIE